MRAPLIIIPFLGMVLAATAEDRLRNPLEFSSRSDVASSVESDDATSSSSSMRSSTFLSMVEASAEAESMRECLARDVCVMAATGEGGRGSAGEEEEDFDPEEREALSEAIDNLRGLLSSLDSGEEETAGLFPHTRAVVAAHEVGRRINNRPLCRWLFPRAECPRADDTPMMEEETQGRVTCPATSRLCPAFAMGCGLCGMVPSVPCPTLCPVAAFYCGTSAYACRARKIRQIRRRKKKGTHHHQKVRPRFNDDEAACPMVHEEQEVMVDLNCLDSSSDPFGNLGCGSDDGLPAHCRLCGGKDLKPCGWGRAEPRTEEEKRMLMEADGDDNQDEE